MRQGEQDAPHLHGGTRGTPCPGGSHCVGAPARARAPTPWADAGQRATRTGASAESGRHSFGSTWPQRTHLRAALTRWIRTTRPWASRCASGLSSFVAKRPPRRYLQRPAMVRHRIPLQVSRPLRRSHGVSCRTPRSCPTPTTASPPRRSRTRRYRYRQQRQPCQQARPTLPCAGCG